MDPHTGSENLQAYSWFCFCIGGAVFGAIGGFLLDEVDPSIVFYITSLLGALIVINGLCTSPKLEESAEAIIKMSLGDRTRLTFRETWQGLKIKPLLRCTIFFFIYCSFVPSYSNYLYYYLTDELGFSQLLYSSLNIVGCLTLLIFVFGYNLCFREAESTTMLTLCCGLKAFGSFNSMMLTRG